MPSLRLAPLLAIAFAALAVSIACDDGAGGLKRTPTTARPAASTAPAADGPLSLTSGAFEDNGTMPVRYTCDGDNVSPPLEIGGAPAEAITLALTVIDIDGPGGAFVHWVVWNIDPATGEVAEGAVPSGAVEGLTSRGGPGYFGPCPPSGTHRYVFTLYALDAELALDPQLNGAPEIETATEGHVLGRAQLTGTYARAQ